MRVLTFNSHQPYLHLLATVLPWQFGVITPVLPSGQVRLWNTQIRPLPGNIRLFPSTGAALQDSTWDWVLTHNAQDLLDARDIPLPKVFLIHGTLSGRILQDRANVDRAAYLRNLQVLLKAGDCRVVYISALKKDDWGIPGEVIKTAIDPSQYGGYRGDRYGILQVCNHLRERGAMLGWDVHQAVCRDLPCLVLGENRGLAESRMASSWDDLREQYRTFRVCLHTAVHPFEDGYNLALLEAMATGMPVASLKHPTSPIEDGVEGVLGETPGELRAKVLRLLGDPAEAIRMGHAARMKLERAFPLGPFLAGWQAMAASVRSGEKISISPESR